MPSTGTFDRDSAVTRVSDGLYTTTLSDRWNARPGSLNGGYSLGVALRALADSMADAGLPEPLPDPLVVSAFFLRPATPGPAEIRTDLARAGKRTATGESRLLRDGAEIVRLVATFTDLSQSRGRTLELGAPPALPPPAECLNPRDGFVLPGATIADRVEVRCPAPPGWALGRPSGDPSASFWLRFTDGREPDTMSLPSLVDACMPVVMELGARGSSTLELTVQVRARPAPGWLACRVATRHVIDGYHEEDFDVWDSRGRLVAQARQLALLPAGDA